MGSSLLAELVCTWDAWWDPRCLWRQMSWFERGIAILFIAMTVQTVAVAVDRAWRYFIARRQTKQFLHQAAASLRGNRLEDALAMAKNFPRSHVATVIASGVETFLAAARMPWAASAAEIGSHAAERTRKRLCAELAVGCNSLSNIAAAAPFVGVGATVVGILNAFRGSSVDGCCWQNRVAAALFTTLLPTAVGVLVAIAAMAIYRLLQMKLATLDLEMSNVSSELLTKFKAQPMTSVSFERAEAVPSLSSELYKEVSYDRQKMFLWPVWIFGVLIGWPLIPFAFIALYDMVVSKPATTYGLGMRQYGVGWDPWTEWTLPWFSRIILVLLAVLMVRTVYVFVERLIRFRRARLATKEFVSESEAARREFDLNKLMEIARQHRKSPVARITAGAVDAFQRSLPSQQWDEAVEFGLRAGERRQHYVIAELSIGLRSLASIAGVAVFIGVGGTFVGIMEESFRGYVGSRYEFVGMVAAGAAESLWMTVSGLFVAILALMSFNHLRNGLQAIEVEASNTLSELVTYFEQCLRSPERVEESVEPPEAQDCEAAYDRHELLLIPIWGVGVFVVCLVVWRAAGAPTIMW